MHVRLEEMSGRNNNRFMRWLLFITVAMVCVVITLMGLHIDKRPRPKTASDIVGSWVGMSEAGVYTYRLVLHQDGTGLFGMQFVDAQPSVYKVLSWKLEGKKLMFLLSPAEPSAEAISLKGSVRPTRIGLIIIGIDNNWKHAVEMWNEERVLRRIQSIKSAMENLEWKTIKDKGAE